MRLILFALVPLALSGQDDPPAVRTESVIVTGTFEPVPLDESDRDVSAFPLTSDERLLVSTPLQLLREDSSIDVRGRAPSGVQSDVSIRGASFGQTLVLLNGVRLSSFQTMLRKKRRGPPIIGSGCGPVSG